MNLDQFLKQDLTKPEFANAIVLNYQGITFHVYGVLHGITGGTNREYVDFINHTIAHAPGLKLGEKSMLKMYKGLDGELDDWMQMTNKDTFSLTMRLFMSPPATYNIIKTTIKEKLTKYDRFDINNRQLSDLGGSPYFHLLDPILRRGYLGFPSSHDYFIQNYHRRQNTDKSSLKIIRPDPDWKWLTYIEKYVNIPYRSVHMIENAVLQAKENNATQVSLLIGETHSSDIHWYVNRAALEPHLEHEIEKIKADAHMKNKLSRKIQYLASAGAAATIPMAITFFILIQLGILKP